MSIAEIVEKYISNAQQAFGQIERSRQKDDARNILDYAERYLEDALYYRSQKRFEVALASVAYCEGLLDALRLLEMVKFQWAKESQ